MHLKTVCICARWRYYGTLFCGNQTIDGEEPRTSWEELNVELPWNIFVISDARATIVATNASVPLWTDVKRHVWRTRCCALPSSSFVKIGMVGPSRWCCDLWGMIWKTVCRTRGPRWISQEPHVGITSFSRTGLLVCQPSSMEQWSSHRTPCPCIPCPVFLICLSCGITPGCPAALLCWKRHWHVWLILPFYLFVVPFLYRCCMNSPLCDMLSPCQICFVLPLLVSGSSLRLWYVCTGVPSLQR